MKSGLILAAVPASAAAAVWAATARDGVELPWLMLGTHLRADATAQVFLALAAVVWTVAALAVGPTLRARDVRARRLIAWAAVALVGNLGAAVAQDVVSFFAFFSLMSLAAYGLVAARATAPAYRAGRIYIGMAVVAEAALLAGIILAVDAAGSLDMSVLRAATADADARGAIIALLMVGLGVKAGLLGLHLWLPLAYSAAPLPAAAVLAGALTELGVLGWLRLLPIGQAGLTGWGVLLVALGAAAVVHAVLVGATQSAATAVLGYSSIGQIGLMTAGVGVALARPDLAPQAVAAVLVLALLHGIVKGVLFIALGVAAAAVARARAVAMAAVVLLALMLVGAPLTGGAVAKDALKAPAGQWWGPLELALSLSAVATTVLMGRMLFLVLDRARPHERLPGRGPAAGLAVGAAAALALPACARWWGPYADAAGPYGPSPQAVWSALWPILAGGAVAWGLHRLTVVRPGVRPRIPTGDVVVAAERVGARAQALARAVAAALAAFSAGARRRAERVDLAPLSRAAGGVEARLGVLAVGILALAAVTLALVALMAGGGT